MVGKPGSGDFLRLENAGFRGMEVGEPGGARTRDHKLKRLVLYQLSYRPNKIPKRVGKRSKPIGVCQKGFVKI